MKILLIRFSAIGNVAMIVPLLDSLTRNHTEDEFVIVSRTFLQPLFKDFPRVTFIGADIRNEHKGFIGFFKLLRKIKSLKVDRTIDLQNNLRSHLLRLFLGKKSFVLRTNPLREFQLTRKGFKKSKSLKSMFDHYAKTMEQAGLKSDNLFVQLPSQSAEQFLEKINWLYGKKEGDWIGIAPFAQHKGKILPLRKMKTVLTYFDKQPQTKIFLFGAGEVENEILKDWETLYNNVYAVHSSLNLEQELALMKQLDVMVCMDSANMHLASLAGIPVVSIWGATHHFGGYLGWKQSIQNIVETGIECRPCSMIGDKKCKRKDYACLNSIQEKEIIEKTEVLLKNR